LIPAQFQRWKKPAQKRDDEQTDERVHKLKDENFRNQRVFVRGENFVVFEIVQFQADFVVNKVEQPDNDGLNDSWHSVHRKAAVVIFLLILLQIGPQEEISEHLRIKRENYQR
jgi:hypothetical protein